MRHPSPDDPSARVESLAMERFLRSVHNDHAATVVAQLDDRPALARVADEQGLTALHHLAHRPDRIAPATIATALVRHGADREAQSVAGMSPLRHALARHNPSFVLTLLGLGANPNGRSSDGEPVLNVAVSAADDTLVNALLDAGADPHATDRSGYAPLHLVMYHDTPLSPLDDQQSLVRILDRLLALGVDPRRPVTPSRPASPNQGPSFPAGTDGTGTNGTLPDEPLTPLRIGAQRGATGTVERLLNLGLLPSDPDAQRVLVNEASTQANGRHAWNGLAVLLRHGAGRSLDRATHEAWLRPIPAGHEARRTLERWVLDAWSPLTPDSPAPVHRPRL